MSGRVFLASTVFHFIQAILFPLAIVGYVFWVVRLVQYARKSGASATVLASLYTRWMQHQLGTRSDEPCDRLMRVLPNVPQWGLRLITAPTVVGHQLTGYVPTIYRYPYEGEPPFSHQPGARTTFFDQALQRHLAAIEQLVILGAGLDTRSYRAAPGTRTPLQQSVKCFEVDTPWTQSFKLEMLNKAGVDTTGVTYVSADFLHEDWLEKLVEAGFDPSKRSFFLWESVTPYLDRQAVESTLHKIASTASGSVVAFDYLSAELIAERSLLMTYARAALSAGGERWIFGFDTTPPVKQRVAAFVAACGLSLEEQRNIGHETERQHAQAGFAVATV